MKLKLQYFGHLMQRANSFGKTLMLGKIEGRRRRGRQRMWRIPWTEEPGRPHSPWGYKELDIAERLTLSLSPWQQECGSGD